MTEQQADALMEHIECWEDATRNSPYDYSDTLDALTALCRHRDRVVWLDIYYSLTDDWENYLDPINGPRLSWALRDMQTWETT